MTIKKLRFSEEIDSLTNDDVFIKLSFRPSEKDIFNIINKSPRCKILYVQKSCLNISKCVINMLHVNKILLSREDVYVDENFTKNAYIYSFIRKGKLHGLNDEEIYDILKGYDKLSDAMLKIIISET